MTTDHARRVRDLFDHAVELPFEQRADFLSESCGAESELRTEVEALLAEHDAEPSFLDHPTARHGNGAQGATPVDRLKGYGLPEIEGYRMVRAIGAGGMGVVYEAQQEHPKRGVAIKVIHQTRLTDQRMAVRRKLFGENHPEIANALNNLASTLQHLDRYDEAEAYFREALGIFRKAHGNGHPDVGTALANLGVLLNARGQYVEAEPVLREAVELRERLLGPENPSHAYSLLALTESVLRQGRAAEAEQLARRALEVREGALPPDHWLIPYTQAFLGECMFARGRFDSAEPLIVGSAQKLEELRGREDKYTQLTFRRARRMYEAWGRPQEASKYQIMSVNKVDPNAKTGD